MTPITQCCSAGLIVLATWLAIGVAIFIRAVRNAPLVE